MSTNFDALKFLYPKDIEFNTEQTPFRKFMKTPELLFDSRGNPARCFERSGKIVIPSADLIKKIIDQKLAELDYAKQLEIKRFLVEDNHPNRELLNWIDAQEIVYKRNNPKVDPVIFSLTVEPFGKIEISLDNPMSYSGLIAWHTIQMAKGEEGLPFVETLRAVVRDFGVSGILPSAANGSTKMQYNQLANITGSMQIPVNNLERLYSSTTSNLWFDWMARDGYIQENGSILCTHGDQFVNVEGIKHFNGLLKKVESFSDRFQGVHLQDLPQRTLLWFKSLKLR